LHYTYKRKYGRVYAEMIRSTSIATSESSK
jgi:hypothetical protein